MSNILGVLARVFVDDLDSALGLYQKLTGVETPQRFRFRDVELARVGSFLLLSGNTAGYRDRTATILVKDLSPVVADIEDNGGRIIDGPSAAPHGRRLIAAHPDGSIFEYIEST